MADQTLNRNKRILPPVYFLFAIAVMVLLRFALPVVRWVSWPWNLTGLVPMLIGVALNVVADQQFKRHQTTIKPFQPSSALVTDGGFRFSRNPMYLGMGLILVSLGICLATLPPVIVIPVFAWWMTVQFIAVEEQSLAKQFGQAYIAYRTQVRRWV